MENSPEGNMVGAEAVELPAAPAAPETLEVSAAEAESAAAPAAEPAADAVIEALQKAVSDLQATVEWMQRRISSKIGPL